MHKHICADAGSCIIIYNFIDQQNGSQSKLKKRASSTISLKEIDSSSKNATTTLRDDDLEDDLESAAKLSAGGIALGDKKQSIGSKPVFHYQSAPAQDKSYQ